jgi:hypothetical protein
MGSHRYSATYVERLSDAEARRFLQAVGLITIRGVFEPVESPADPAAGPLLIGRVENEGKYYVDPVGGQVTYVSDYDLEPMHVNVSVGAFGESLRLFEEATNRLLEGFDSSVFVAAADALGTAIEAIDPSALGDEDGFWPSMLADVTNGDYTADAEAE